MNVWQYLAPENPVAVWVIAVLLLLFLAWLITLVAWWFKLNGLKDQLEKCSKGDGLEALGKVIRRESGNLETGVRVPEQAVSEFEKFRRKLALPEDSPVASHIKSIFEAGWNESRLDSGELIRHTASRLLGPNALLRSVLAIFIIVGLLGTLFGLAESLSQLSPPAAGGSPQSNAELSKGLSQLLGQLKSAFGPSIIGIALTIIGVLVYSLYLQLAAAPVRATLERLTLTVWVPLLYPTASQRMLETLLLSEQQMRRSFEAAEKVAKFSEDIQQEVVDLKDSLEGAAGPLAQLAQSSIRINTYADRLVEMADKLLPFQEEIKALYGQMLGESKTFHNSVQKNIEDSSQFQESVRQMMSHQHEEIVSLLGVMKSYEASYIEERGTIDAKLKDLLDEAKSAYTSAAEKNRQLVEEIGDPLRKDLSEKLGAVEETLRVQLIAIQEKFGAFDAPINKAANKIEGSLETVVARTEALNQEFHREFLAQAENYNRQLESLNASNEKIADLLNRLSSAATSQGESAGTLNGTVSELAGNVTSLSASVVALSGAISANGGGRAAGTQTPPSTVRTSRSVDPSQSPGAPPSSHGGDNAGGSPLHGDAVGEGGEAGDTAENEAGERTGIRRFIPW